MVAQFYAISFRVRKFVAISFRNIPFVQNGPSQPGGHLHTNDVLPLSLTQWPLFWHLNSVQGACLLHESPVNSLVIKQIFIQLHIWWHRERVGIYDRKIKTRTHLKAMAVWFHVHVQPTASAVVAQVAAAWCPIAICNVPASCNRRIVECYRLVVDRQSAYTSGERNRKSGRGAGWHAGQIWQTS